MSGEEISLGSHHPHHHLVFPDDALRFARGGPPAPPPPQQQQPHIHRPRVAVVGGTDPKPSQTQQPPLPPPTTRELVGFIDDKFFSNSTSSAAGTGADRYFSPSGPPPAQNFSRSIFDRGNSLAASGDDSEDDDEGRGDDEGEEDDAEDEDDDDVDGGDGDIDHHSSNNNNSSNRDSNGNSNATRNSNASNAATATGGGNSVSNLDKLGNGKAKHVASFGPVGDVLVVNDDGGGRMGQAGNNENVVTIAEPDGEMYYSRYLQAAEGSGGKEMDGGENGCGFTGRKENSLFSNGSGESLRQILSDPVTRDLMDDAMILPCGHSFGKGGIRHIIGMKACYTCSQSVSEDSISPNLSLQAAVQAFRREEEAQFCRQSKRKREKFDQDKGNYGDSTSVDGFRTRGVQFPFSVTDRVIIKVLFLQTPKFFLQSYSNSCEINNEGGNNSGKQEDPTTVCWAGGYSDNTMLEWMVCCKDVGQCRECKIAVSFSGKGSRRSIIKSNAEQGSPKLALVPLYMNGVEMGKLMPRFR